jgi:hypothetical protein
MLFASVEGRTLDPHLAADPDRRLTATQTCQFLCLSRRRLRLLEKTGALVPVERTGGGPRFRLADVRALARGERPIPKPGVVLAGGRLR